jgi:hypothetical protein
MRNGAHPVILEPPEGVLRVVGLSGRAELLEQPGKVRIDLLERDVCPFPPTPPGQEVQDEERLVPGTLVASTPDVELVEQM